MCLLHVQFDRGKWPHLADLQCLDSAIWAAWMRCFAGTHQCVVLICTTLASTHIPICTVELHALSWLKLRGQLQFAGLHNGLLQSHHVLRILPWACTTFCQPIGLMPCCQSLTQYFWHCLMCL